VPRGVLLFSPFRLGAVQIEKSLITQREKVNSRRGKERERGCGRRNRDIAESASVNSAWLLRAASPRQPPPHRPLSPAAAAR